MRFDLIDLRLFLLVLETGSITHGAAQASLSLPSASARLRGMEDTIGLPLLTRGRRGVESTPAGDTLAHHARLVLRQMDELHGELGEYSKGLKAQVRLWTNTAAMTEFLPAALAPFLAARPNVDIVLKERLSAEIVKAVAGGVAEVGIVTRAVDHANLALFPFAVDRLVLVVPRESEFARTRRISFSAVAGHAFVGLSAGSPLQDYLGEHAARAGHAVAYRVRLRTFDAICRMAAQGVGFGVVPETAARRCRRSMPIAIVHLTDAWALRHLDVCVRDMESLTPVARELVTCLAASPRG